MPSTTAEQKKQLRKSVRSLLTALSPEERTAGDRAMFQFGKFDWYNFFVILGSVTIFAVLLRPAGLIPATAVMVFLSSFGNRPFRWIRTLLLCVFLSVAVWLIFVLGLDLTVPIWPAFLTN